MHCYRSYLIDNFAVLLFLPFYFYNPQEIFLSNLFPPFRIKDCCNWKKVDRTEKRYQKRIEELEKECEEVEQFIENITDSLTRRIFRMYFTEGMRRKDISKVVHIESSGVSKRIRRFLDKHLT